MGCSVMRLNIVTKAGLRRIAWRLGRRIYAQARGESLNVIETNGELAVQRDAIVGAARGEGPVVICDIGANVGEWSLAALAQARTSGLDGGRFQLHAFEPVPGTRTLLEAALEGQAGVLVHPMAMSSTAGTATINVLADGAGTNSLERDTGAREVSTQVTIETDTLTNLANRAGVEQIAFAKIDTEGHDFLVLSGAEALLQAGRIDALQFEYNHRWIFARRYLKDVFDLRDKAAPDYVIGRVCADRIEVLDAWHPELERFFEANYVMIHPAAIARFNLYRGTFDVSNTYA
jgi:FkbM family methyltransferase